MLFRSPPTLRGFRQAAIYPVRPDLGKARALAAGNARSGRGKFYICDRGPCLSVAQIVQANLRAIGIDVDILRVPGGFSITHRRGEPFDISMETRTTAYFDPQDFLMIFDGTTIRPRDNTNFSYFDSSLFNRKLAQASSLVGEPRYRAFGQLDVDLARDAAPLGAYMNDNARRFFSARVRNFFEHPVYGLDLSAIAVQ